MTPPSDYIYDVFLSYKHAHPVKTWVRDHFLKDFIGYLGEELAREPQVFFDKDDVIIGEISMQKIRQGLQTSRVLVAVCSARYFFDSKYCLMEWETFGEHTFRGITVTRPRIPIRFNDGECFPPEAQVIQQADFSDCNYTHKPFYEGDPRAVIFEDKIREVAKAVARSISIAPPFYCNFPVVEPTEPANPPMLQTKL